MPDLIPIIEDALRRGHWLARRDHSDEDKLRTVAQQIANDIEERLALYGYVPGDHLAKGG